jgi:membrane protein YqaA with SNARE-associated domain
MTDQRQFLDRFAHSRAAQWAAFAWGLAEATLFFIVPDVLLTAIACRSLRAGLKASCVAVAGALLGGILMYGAGHAAPQTARAWLVRLPAIHPPLIQHVQMQLASHGLGAVLLGPALGIPYKIYAVEWGVGHGNELMFLVVSIPARGVRFVLSAVVANGIARLIAPWTRRRAPIETTILALFWIGFYALYLAHFGW